MSGGPSRCVARETRRGLGDIRQRRQAARRQIKKVQQAAGKTPTQPRLRDDSGPPPLVQRRHYSQGAAQHVRSPQRSCFAGLANVTRVSVTWLALCPQFKEIGVCVVPVTDAETPLLHMASGTCQHERQRRTVDMAQFGVILGFSDLSYRDLLLLCVCAQ